MKVFEGNFLKNNLRVLLAATLVAVFVITPNIARAAATSSSTAAGSANGFIVSPVKTQLTIPKGTTQVIQMSVTNPTPAPLTAEAIVNDFNASDDESGVPRIILNNAPPLPTNSFRSLVQPIANFHLNPGQRTYFNVVISVPTNVNSGGYYGAIRFVPLGLVNSKSIGLTASVGSLFLVTVPGNLNEKISLVQLSAVNGSQTPESYFFSGKVSVLTRVDNEGNIYFAPVGTVQVKSMTGKIVEQYEFNKSQGDILEGSIRKYIDPLSYTNWFGRYTITESVAAVSGSGNYVIATASFWYIPFKYIIILLVVIALIVFYVVRRRKKHSKAKSAKTTNSSPTPTPTV